LVIDHNLIERLCGFKLLRVHISDDLSWNLHVDYICARAARLHYFKRLKRAGLPTDRGAICYVRLSLRLRPVLEYCAVVWHHDLRKYQTEAIEAIERRAIRIIRQADVVGRLKLYCCPFLGRPT